MTSSSQRLALLEAVVEQSFNAVLITDANLANGGPLIVYVNPAFCTMTGYTADELIGVSPRILQGADTDPQVIERLRQCLSERLFLKGRRSITVRTAAHMSSSGKSHRFAMTQARFATLCRCSKTSARASAPSVNNTCWRRR
ncbi:hypothetical protein PSTH1771_12535 [Pseudomonas syringae pv. theae]|nr:hypothetical protein PSTH68_00365 [Pseudomonas syringae pv. theae]GKQ46405.1 hypothetical protein PSTH2693_14635 [Pseudomonas syringae pv. theae]GKS05845.1 hypothetical protein PSTH1771_12535 [Pseudomonas syringae pv. theae]